MGLNTLRDLNSVRLSDFTSNKKFSDERRYLANAPIRCAILSGTKNREIFYDVFYRLNSGSVPLSGQELRQVFYKGDFAQYLFEATSEAGPLHALLGITGPDPRLFDIELILRYLAINLDLAPYRGDLRAYLDTTMQELSESWPARSEKIRGMRKELDDVIEATGEHFGAVFMGRKYTGAKLSRRFNKAVFEVQAYYFSRLSRERLIGVPAEQFKDAFKNLCRDPSFRSSIEATTKSHERFQARFNLFSRLRKKQCRWCRSGGLFSL